MKRYGRLLADCWRDVMFCLDTLLPDENNSHIHSFYVHFNDISKAGYYYTTSLVYLREWLACEKRVNSTASEIEQLEFARMNFDEWFSQAHLRTAIEIDKDSGFRMDILFKALTFYAEKGLLWKVLEDDDFLKNIALNTNNFRQIYRHPARTSKHMCEVIKLYPHSSN